MTGTEACIASRGMEHGRDHDTRRYDHQNRHTRRKGLRSEPPEETLPPLEPARPKKMDGNDVAED